MTEYVFSVRFCPSKLKTYILKMFGIFLLLCYLLFNLYIDTLRKYIYIYKKVPSDFAEGFA